MSDSSSKLDVKFLISLAGLLGSLSGIFGTWALLQYRMDQLEARLDKMESRQGDAEKATMEQAYEIRCQICQVHSIPCPGCR